MKILLKNKGDFLCRQLKISGGNEVIYNIILIYWNHLQMTEKRGGKLCAGENLVQ